MFPCLMGVRRGNARERRSSGNGRHVDDYNERLDVVDETRLDERWRRTIGHQPQNPSLR
jgi:hypothetical protein